MAAKKYIDLEGLVAFWAKVNTYIATELAKKANTGDIPDVSSFITKSVSDLTNYYTKTNTYTKTEVNDLINGVKQFTYESVQTLPAASAGTMNKIYLVPSSNSATQNIKDEYITIQDGSSYKWEQIGSTAIDLSGYVTSPVLTNTLNDYVLSSDQTEILKAYVTSAALTTTLNSYVTGTSLTDTLRNYVTSSALTTKLNDYVLASTYGTDMNTINGNFTTINNKLNDITTATVAECEGVVTGS